MLKGKLFFRFRLMERKKRFRKSLWSLWRACFWLQIYLGVPISMSTRLVGACPLGRAEIVVLQLLRALYSKGRGGKERNERKKRRKGRENWGPGRSPGEIFRKLILGHFRASLRAETA